eukprot:scaffold771_cov170-Amphora_coffeaeformis.AAC.16
MTALSTVPYQPSCREMPSSRTVVRRPRVIQPKYVAVSECSTDNLESHSGEHTVNVHTHLGKKESIIHHPTDKTATPNPFSRTPNPFSKSSRISVAILSD